MASVACCLLARQVFLTDLCPAGEKRVKFEGCKFLFCVPAPVQGRDVRGSVGLPLGLPQVFSTKALQKPSFHLFQAKKR